MMPASDDVQVVERPDGRVLIRELGADRREVVVESSVEGRFISRSSCVTRYPVELVESVLGVKGLAYLCEEIGRDEDPAFVESVLRWAVLGYVEPEAFRGRRLLDFGSGAGASTMILARLFPETEIVGVELMPELLALAEARARFHGVGHVTFRLSPSATELPADIGTFDYIIFSAVYEHLLPAERRALFPRVWDALRPGGIMFLNQTPYRWYPHEYHTTGLPLLNYVPDALVLRLARRWSSRVSDTASWEELLRDGVRGGTAAEVVRRLRDAGREPPVVLRPSRNGCRDTIDIWYGYSSARRPALKKAMRAVFKAIHRMTGQVVTPELDLALQRPGQLPAGSNGPIVGEEPRHTPARSRGAYSQGTPARTSGDS
jgi:SAM-dependent methyltransferase